MEQSLHSAVPRRRGMGLCGLRVKSGAPVLQLVAAAGVTPPAAMERCIAAPLHHDTRARTMTADDRLSILSSPHHPVLASPAAAAMCSISAGPL